MFKCPKDLLIIDVETTGIAQNASIIQLGAVIFDKSGKQCNTSFNQYIIPYTANWEEEASKIHKITRPFLAKNGELLEYVIESFEDWATKNRTLDLEKTYWLAQWSGSGFDTNMLKNAYAILNKKYPFHYRTIDISSIVRFELANRGKLNVKCGEKECAEALGIEVIDTKLHDGLYDAQLSGQMLEKLVREA